MITLNQKIEILRSWGAVYDKSSAKCKNLHGAEVSHAAFAPKDRGLPARTGWEAGRMPTVLWLPS